MGEFDSTPLLFFMLQYIIEELREFRRKRKIKKELSSRIYPALLNVESALDQFFDAYMMYVGYAISGNYITVPKPEEKSDHLIRNLRENYQNFVAEVHDFCRILKTHESYFQEIMEEKWIPIQVFIEGFNSDPPDWVFISKHEKIQQFDFDKMSPVFVLKLGRELDTFIEEINCPTIARVSDVADLFSDKKFIKCVLKCFFAKYKIMLK